MARVLKNPKFVCVQGRRVPLVFAAVLALALIAGPAPVRLERFPPDARAAPANDKLTYTSTALTEGPADLTAMYVRMGLSTVLVLGLCVGSLWIGKRWLGLGGLPAKPAGAGQLRVTEALALGRNCYVYLLDVGGQAILAGVDGTGLKTLIPLSSAVAERSPR